MIVSLASFYLPLNTNVSKLCIEKDEIDKNYIILVNYEVNVIIIELIPVEKRICMYAF